VLKAVAAFARKNGRFASEDVVVNVLDTKCIAPMLYGIEACPVTSRHKHSLDFTVRPYTCFYEDILY